MFDKTEQEIMKNWQGDISKPVVSICTITYNHAKYIAEAIDSFLMQETDFPFEILVDDDCSPDNTSKIIKEYQSKYPKIIKPLLRKKNIGAITNYVENIKRARGKYIAICEGDDYWTDNSKLQVQKDFLDKNKEYVICYGKVEAFDENGTIENYVEGTTKDLTQDEMKKTTPINSLTVMFRNIIEEFPNEINFSKIGDLFLWVLLSDYGKGKYLSHIKPSRYRMHSGGIYSKVSMKQKKMMRFTLNSALVCYYANRKDEINKMYFVKRIFKSFLGELGLINLLIVIKEVLFNKIRTKLMLKKRG